MEIIILLSFIIGIFFLSTAFSVNFDFTFSIIGILCLLMTYCCFDIVYKEDNKSLITYDKITITQLNSNKAERVQLNYLKCVYNKYRLTDKCLVYNKVVVPTKQLINKLHLNNN